MYSTLQFIVSQLEQQGFALADITAGTHISTALVNDPWPYLSQEQYHRLVNNIFELSADPAIGLNLSIGFKARHMGIPGYAALSSDTFAKARTVLMNYRVLKDPYIYLSHSLDNNHWLMNLASVYTAQEAVMRFSVEGHIIRTADFCEDLTGHRHSLSRINVSYPAPPYAELYERLLPCPVYFEQSSNSISFDPSILRQRLPNADPALFDLCRRECDQQLRLLDANNSFENKVYDELFRAHSRSSSNLLSLHDVANRLYISPRTLRRKLQTEHTSFQTISNQARKDLALHYLTNSDLTTKAIAYALGYSSVNNFHRAFKQWTGKPVSEYSHAPC